MLGTDFEALGGDVGAGAVGGQDILLFRNIKAGSLRTLAPFFSPQVPSSRPPSSRAPRRPHSPGLRGAHKARQLELKIYAKQLLTGCKGVQLCAGRGWEPALKAQEVAPRPRVKRKTPQWAEGIRQVLTPSCCLGDLSLQQPAVGPRLRWKEGILFRRSPAAFRAPLAVLHHVLGQQAWVTGS